MLGDFSRWFAKVPKNQVGILAQEGRILLDADVNAQSLLGARWQDLAARAAFGANVAAIPADQSDAWRVSGAHLVNNQVSIDVMPGLAWVDGLLVELDGLPTQPVQLIATPLGPPLQLVQQNIGAAGTRDAVILEVWRRSLNGYQVPLDLIEPALGGPDTAERIETAYALRLYRMDPSDTCRTLKLGDDLSQHGRLHATLAPTTMTSGDCPVVDGGGYTGLEHDLYRVEIAEVDNGAPSFKWSQWNGGLVGRGTYDAAAKKLSLIAGDQAILRSGLTSFYVEVLVLDASVGRWRGAYGVPATLDTNGEIDLSQPARFGAPPLSTDSWFVRIWNGLRPIADFPAGAANELRDGIRLELSADGGTFAPGDYWTFQVRTGMDNPSPLVDHAPPFGIHHHRVPLAELHWAGANGAEVEDCRVPLQPLTATDGCCTHSVGDGVTSHGDFSSIQAAVDALPDAGGRVCVLPGTYVENVAIKFRRDVEIVGCGPRSRVVAAPTPGEFNASLPAIYVVDTSGIKIEKLYVEGGFQGIAILLEADAGAGWTEPDGTFTTPILENMRVADCVVKAGSGGGIEIRGGAHAELEGNHVSIDDTVMEWSLITLSTTSARIERNIVVVDQGRTGEYRAPGGIWLRGGCVDIEVIDNEIAGGSGHGVMLGHAEQSALTSGNFSHELAEGHFGYVINGLLDDDCVGCGPGPIVFPRPGKTPPWVAGDPLERIRIRNNEIHLMGMSGIGVMGFFSIAEQGVIVVDRLEIVANRLFDNIARKQAVIDDDMVERSAYGAISLAHVTDLTVRDNEIWRNGHLAHGGVTGVFVLSAAGADVSRNKIYGNGPLQPPQINRGTPHGGVWIAGVTAPTDTEVPVPRWRPSAMVRDNEIHAPNGPSLFIYGYGYMQIVDNVLVSEGVTRTTLKATSVSIVNGSSIQNLKTPASFVGLRANEMTMATRDAKVTVAGKVISADNLETTDLAGAKVMFGSDIALIDAVLLPPPGAVMFNSNQVITHTPKIAAGYGVMIAAHVDVSVVGNQFSSDAPDAPPHVTIVGTTLRAESNRCSDRALLSLMTYGMYNITAQNICDHCIHATATHQVVNQQNLEVSAHLCKAFGRLFPNLGGVKQ